MTKAARFRQSDLERALRALRAAGETISGVEINPDGSFRVLTGNLTPKQPRDEYEEWKLRRSHRAADPPPSTGPGKW